MLPDADDGSKRRALDALFAAGRRVVAVAAKPAPELTTITADDECDLMLAGFLVFADEPKAAARESLAQLAALGIEVKIATGDNPRVAEKVCAETGFGVQGHRYRFRAGVADEDEFAAAAQNHTIFARITPEQKAHLIKSARRTGGGRLRPTGKDALALHAADLEISVDSAQTSPRTRRMWSCWRKTWGCWLRVSRRVGGSSRTP